MHVMDTVMTKLKCSGENTEQKHVFSVFLQSLNIIDENGAI